jgi:c-di-AMP phosphodiesterase-like protein
MEQLGGGGHLTNAAAQLDGTLEDAKRQIIEQLQDMYQEERLFE